MGVLHLNGAGCILQLPWLWPRVPGRLARATGILLPLEVHCNCCQNTTASTFGKNTNLLLRFQPPNTTHTPPQGLMKTERQPWKGNFQGIHGNRREHSWLWWLLAFLLSRAGITPAVPRVDSSKKLHCLSTKINMRHLPKIPTWLLENHLFSFYKSLSWNSHSSNENLEEKGLIFQPSGSGVWLPHSPPHLRVGFHAKNPPQDPQVRQRLLLTPHPDSCPHFQALGCGCSCLLPFCWQRLQRTVLSCSLQR